MALLSYIIKKYLTYYWLTKEVETTKNTNITLIHSDGGKAFR
jgi:hypothetical protein